MKLLGGIGNFYMTFDLKGKKQHTQQWIWLQNDYCVTHLFKYNNGEFIKYALGLWAAHLHSISSDCGMSFGSFAAKQYPRAWGKHYNLYGIGLKAVGSYFSQPAQDYL